MPVPMIAPMPSAVRSQAVRVFSNDDRDGLRPRGFVQWTWFERVGLITVPPLAAGMAKGAVGSTSFCSIWVQV